jgi:hypothetical protein
MTRNIICDTRHKEEAIESQHSCDARHSNDQHICQFYKNKGKFLIEE